MRIAMFTETYRPQINGVVTSIEYFRKELEERGHDVYVFAPGDRARREGKVYYFPSKSFKKYPEYRIAIPMRIRRAFKEIKPEIVHSHGPFSMGVSALMLSKHYERPIVASYHTPIEEYLELITKKEKIRKLLGKISLKYAVGYYNRCDLTLTPSKVVLRQLVSNGLKQGKVLPNGIRVEEFENGNPDFLSENYGIENAILHVGRLCKEKKVQVLIRAFSKLENDASLVILSDGPYRKELERLARELGLEDRVIFTGYVERRMLKHFYASSLFVVVPSTVETQCLVVLEAMASGRTVIGARAMALPETIKHRKNGLLFEPDNVEDLAKKMSLLLENGGMRRKLEKRAKMTARAFDIKRMAARLEKVYDSFL